MSVHKLEIVGIRLVREQSWYSEKVLTIPENVVELLSEKLSCYAEERFCILNLSSKNQVINLSIVGVGTLSNVLVHPREVFKSAILSNAASIMLIHNHISGISEPSQYDIQTTKRLEKSGLLLGIEVLDHIIIGSEHNLFSFKKNGLM